MKKVLLIYKDEDLVSIVKAVSANQELHILHYKDELPQSFEQFSLIIINASDNVCDTILDHFDNKVPILRVDNSIELITHIKQLAKGLVGAITFPLSGAYLFKLIEQLEEDQHLIDQDKMQSFAFSHAGKKIEITLNSQVLIRSFGIAIDNLNLKHSIDVKNSAVDVLSSTSHRESSAKDLLDLKKIENDVINGIKAGEFKVSYQPVHLLENDHLSGFEALLRWKKGEKYISPELFIPQVERTDAIFPLSEWVIEHTLSDLARWNKMFACKGELRVNVNISARLFETSGLADRIIERVAHYDIEPTQVGLELTESAFMDSKEVANMVLLKLKAGNFPIYMDDFGTGYSSLSYLQHFPVDILKIDKSFVKWLTFDEDSEHIVNSIIGLAHGLNMKVVGEGVEERSQIDYLKKHGCKYGQGFFYSRSMFYQAATDYISKFYKEV